MIKIIVGFFVFLFVLFLYLHIHYHLKTSDDLEIYEVDELTKDRIEEILNLRQPTLFTHKDMDKLTNALSFNSLIANYSGYELKVRNTKDINPENELYVPLPLNKCISLFDKDKKACYFSENNQDFLSETGLTKKMQAVDESLRPSFVSNTYYDIMMGGEEVTTPFRYDINYRNYYVVTQGTVKIKLCPPNNTKYLECVNDYENFEFISAIDPWGKSNNRDKIKYMDLTLHVGDCLFIPSYWWYSIKFSSNSSLATFKYRTYMSTLSILPQICLYFLQNQNIKHKATKRANKVSFGEPDDTEIDIEIDKEEVGSDKDKDKDKERESRDASVVKMVLETN